MANGVGITGFRGVKPLQAAQLLNLNRHGTITLRLLTENPPQACFPAMDSRDKKF
jgi:hypothetical protein